MKIIRKHKCDWLNKIEINDFTWNNLLSVFPGYWKLCWFIKVELSLLSESDKLYSFPPRYSGYLCRGSCNQQHSLLHVRKLAAYDVALCVDFFFNTFFRCHDKLSFHWFWSQQTSQQKGGFTYIEHGDYT